MWPTGASPAHARGAVTLAAATSKMDRTISQRRIFA
jgi:hypothetical protein